MLPIFIAVILLDCQIPASPIRVAVSTKPQATRAQLAGTHLPHMFDTSLGILPSMLYAHKVLLNLVLSTSLSRKLVEVSYVTSTIHMNL